MPSSTVFSRWPKRWLTQSRSRIAGDEEGERRADRRREGDDQRRPHHRPNTAPPASVSKAAPGSESAVTTTYA
jgi:hypothetical protein